MDFEQIKNKAVEAAQFAAQKAKDLTAMGKVKLNIAREKENVRKAQQELGKLYYRDYVLGEERDSAEYLPWCEKITAARHAMEDLEAQMEELRTGGCDFDAEEAADYADLPDEPEQPSET